VEDGGRKGGSGEGKGKGGKEKKRTGHISVLHKRRKVQRVPHPQADPIRTGHDRGEEELGNVELEEEGEERVGVDVEGVGPGGGE
jgi:pSer/pThr/pTyr-binding forkhead associated (FHA) protein